ncbi:MAG: ATP-binding cassette domain-containing protein [Acidobacteria bacterium]|nr:ATP-binding cassette domain-containing protein [Acidobacteriota bacterium]
MSEKRPVVRVRNLRFRYPDGVEALGGVDFDLAAGETVALLGANGSGKTTFLLHLVGLLRGEGEIEICGRGLASDTLGYVREKIGVLFQDSDDQLFMPTVAEDVAFGPRNAQMPAEEVERRVANGLAEVSVADLRDRAPHHLSAGQKRRVALAGLLALEPEILLLDEPATFLDPPSRQELVDVLRSLSHAQILVTHDMELARALADRAVFFERGKVAAEGSVDELAERFRWR